MHSAELTDRLFLHGTLEDRCASRVEVEVPAQLRPSGARSFSVIVRDVSAAGFSCEAVTTMRAGSRCFITMPGVESQQAEVVWNNGIMVGCAFSNMLHPLVIERLLGRYGKNDDTTAFPW